MKTHKTSSVSAHTKPDRHTLVQAGTWLIFARLAPSLHQHNNVTFWCGTWARRQTRLCYKQLAAAHSVFVCVSCRSVLRVVCVRVRVCVRIQVKAEPSVADKPRQVSLPCRIDNYRLRRWEAANWQRAKHTQVRTKRWTGIPTDRWTHTFGSERPLYSEPWEAYIQPDRLENG